MALVRLVRVVKREAFCDGNTITLYDNVRALSLKLYDNDGLLTSIAFDGRFDLDDGVEEYGLYRDCPVKTDALQSGPLSDTATLRALRDALNDMNLDAD